MTSAIQSAKLTASRAAKLRHWLACAHHSVKQFAALILVGLMVTAATKSLPERAAQLAAQPPVRRALNWLEQNTDWVTEQHIRIVEIPAPTFQEAERGRFLAELLAAYGLRVSTDAVGNVIGERPGQSEEIVLLTAHLDTVFDEIREIRVQQKSGRLYAPGITDNGTGLAALVAVARALHEAGVRTGRTIVFAANVGEEGEGNLLGMRQLVQTFRPRLHAVISVDGAATDHIISKALASKRLELSVRGPGGHSWSDFGLPNPIHALARGVARFVRVPVPEQPRTSINVGEIRGGTSVNSIPAHASVKVDIRSESPAEIERLERALREAIQAGVTEEMDQARVKDVRLTIEVRELGVRPGGELPEDSPLLAAVRSADQFLGNRSRLERSSTDANVPLALGIPAVTLGGGGQGGGAHSLQEWYDPTDRARGLQRVLLTLLLMTGVLP